MAPPPEVGVQQEQTAPVRLAGELMRNNTERSQRRLV